MSQEDTTYEKNVLEVVQPQSIAEDDSVVASERLAIVGSFYDVTIEDMRSQEQNLRLIRARKVAVYALHENVGLSVRAAAEQLGRMGRGPYATLRDFKESMRQNRMLSQEVAYVGRAKNIKKTIDQRITSRVAEATGIEETRLNEPSEPSEINARNMAIALMMERGYVSCRDVARYFDMTRHKDVLWITKTTSYREAQSPLLSQQMDWIRQKLLTERPATFIYTSPDESQELPASSESLPEIDERLVHPRLVASVYGTIHAAADFYGVPARELIGRSSEFTAARARRAAMIMCNNLNIPTEQLGLCFDGRSPYSIEGSISRATLWAAKDKLFAQELESIARGEQRQDIASQTLQNVCQYYDVTQEDMRSEKQEGGAWQDRARSVFMAVMDRKATLPRAAVGAIIGRTENVTHMTTTSVNQRMAKQPRLKAEVNYLHDPFINTRPLPPKEMLDYVLQSLEIPIDELQDPHTPIQRRARTLAAFILAEETAFPQANIAILLHDKPDNISYYIKKTRKDIIKDPKLALEIDGLLPANAVNRPLTGKILRLIAQKYHYDLRGLLEGDDTQPGYQRALDATIKLMASGAKHPTEAIADLLNVPNEYVAQLVS
jgi:chromosomal replication initiation ATPase DnaA